MQDVWENVFDWFSDMVIDPLVSGWETATGAIGEFFESLWEAFAKKYSVNQDEYDQIYDVFGTLRNPEYLEKVKADYKRRKEYEERSRSYQDDYFNNYREKFFGGGSSYGGFSSSNYNEANKAILKKFYRTLSKAFHPDSNPDKDTSEEMKMLNQLKSEWGL